MSQTKEKKQKFVHPGFNPTNFAGQVNEYPGLDFSNGVVLNRHMQREGNGIKIVEDGYEDKDALIQSEKVNAGLQNILRLQEMRYGTVENAIARNKDRQTYADVSHIPTSVAEQTEYIKNAQAELDALCSKYGVTKEELLKSNLAALQELVAKKNASQGTNSTEGGAE